MICLTDPHTEQSPMRLPPLTQVFFKGGHKSNIGLFAAQVTASSRNIYLLPDNENHPVIDSCILPNKLLNFKVSEKIKPPNRAALDAHLLALPELDEYFLDIVVPATIYKSVRIPPVVRDTERTKKLHVRVVRVNAHRDLQRSSTFRRRV